MTATAEVITIDGPSGTGKGTLCQLIANALQWHMLDSGSLYRVLAYAVRLQGLNFTDVAAMVQLAHQLPVVFITDPHQKGKVLLQDKDVSLALRTEQCGQDASQIAAIPEIREALLARQRAFAMAPGLVTDGRDMGTVIFPEARLKFYLDASSEERAKRRYLQLKEGGIHVSLAQVQEELAKRDARDSERAVAPLKSAIDALIIDTTGLEIMQVLDVMLQSIYKSLPL